MSGLASQLAIYYFFGIAQTLAAVIMQGLAALGKAGSVWHFCRSIFRWLPVYNVAIILVNLAENADPSGAHVSPWSDSVAGTSLKCMLAECFIFGAAALAVDARADVAQALRRFETEGFAPLVAAYRRRDLLLDQAVATSAPEALQGVARGVDEQGALLVGTPDGGTEVRRLVSGEVSVRWAGR